MKKITKKILSVCLVIGVLVTTINILPIMNVLAIESTNNTFLEIESNNTISFEQSDKTTLIYKDGNTEVGRVQVKNGTNPIEVKEINSNGNAIFILPEYVDTTYQISVVVLSAKQGYKRSDQYFFDGTSDYFPGDNIANVDISNNRGFRFDFSFIPDNNGGNQQGEVLRYPVVAYFGDDISTKYEPNEQDKIVIPNNWTKGKITFKSKICTVNGEVFPDNQEDCAGTRSEIPIKPMIANAKQIKETVMPINNEPGVLNASEEFIDYGKLVLHMDKIRESDFNNNSVALGIIAVVAENLINIQANSELGMSNFIGNDYINQAIYTKEGERDTSIFFGNDKTTLVASGTNVVGITAVRGATSTINHGEAIVSLPNLSVETTTKVEVDIELTDGSTFTAKLNINRTAVFLEYGGFGEGNADQLRVGYVLHKDYLYNESTEFDAYLQVILYKDNIVAGYKQIKINDEYLANSLTEHNPAGFMNTFNWDGFGERPLYEPIIAYDVKSGDPVGVNKASVFLTDGPIDYNSDTLPSVEFGIGAGVQISWEAE